MARVTDTVLTALTEMGRARVDQLARRTGLANSQVVDSCELLLRRRLITRVQPGIFRMAGAGTAFLHRGGKFISGPKAPTGPKPRRFTLRERVWRALRMARKATVPELLSLAAIGPQKYALSNVRRYFVALEKAGYVVRMANRSAGTAPTSNGFVRWLIVKDSGPKAPTFNSDDGVVVDPNTEEVIRL